MVNSYFSYSMKILNFLRLFGSLPLQRRSLCQNLLCFVLNVHNNCCLFFSRYLPGYLWQKGVAHSIPSHLQWCAFIRHGSCWLCDKYMKRITINSSHPLNALLPRIGNTCPYSLRSERRDTHFFRARGTESKKNRGVFHFSDTCK